MVVDENKEVVNQPTTPESENKVDYKALYEASEIEKKKFKSRIDELCSENKAYKEKEIANMTEQQRQEMARKEYEEEVQKQLAELASYKKRSSLVDAGFTKDEIELLMENDSCDTYSKIMQARVTKELESAKLKNIKETTVTPRENTTKVEKTYKDYTMEELNKMKIENPALYNKLIK